jgi:hypothetical protein
MTRMTKDETKLLAQAAVIVDSLVPWKKLSDNFQKKNIGVVEPERTLLGATHGKMPFITDLPEDLVSTELFKQIEKAKKAIDDAHTTQASVWYNELTSMYADTPLKNKKYQGLFTTDYKAYYTNSVSPFLVFDPILREFKRAQNDLPANVDQAQCKYIFQKAFAVIRNKERWTQGAYSRTVEVPKTYAFYESFNPMVISETTREVEIKRQTYTDVERVQKFCSAGAILNADGALGDDDEPGKKLSPEALFVGGQTE